MSSISEISESNSNVESKQSEEVSTTVLEENKDQPPAKKARKPFVFTEKRREAFERCRQRREEKAKEKRESGYFNYQIKEYMRAIKHEAQLRKKEAASDPSLLSLPSPHRPQPLPTDCVPTVATELTIPTSQPNLPPPVAVSQMSQKPMEVVEQKIASSLSIELPPATTSIVESEEKIDNKLQTQSQSQDTRKRKVDFAETDTYIGIGAGNHQADELYEEDEDEDNFEEQIQNQPSRNRMDIDDDSLIALLEEAKQRVQQRSIFTQKRTNVKQMRPSQASLFLDSVSGSMTHPSQLFSNHNLHHTAKPKPSTSSFVWL